MERHFDKELNELKQRLLYAGGLAEEMVLGAVKALVERKEEIIGDVCRKEDDVYSAPVAIKELHEFLTVEGEGPVSETYELRAVYA